MPRPKKEPELIEAMDHEPRQHADHRRIRVKWELEIPTDGKGGTSMENVERMVTMMNHVCNSVSQWASSFDNPNPVWREVVRGKGKKPTIILYWTLNSTLARRLCQLNPRFSLME